MMMTMMMAPEPKNVKFKMGTSEDAPCSGVKCSQCNVVLAHPASLNRHLRRVHKIPVVNKRLRARTNPNGIECTVCGNRYSNKANLGRHLFRVHNITVQNEYRRSASYGIPTVPCSRCDKLFTTPGNMRIHVRQVHKKIGKRKKDKENIYDCASCSACFNKRILMVKHLKQHGFFYRLGPKNYRLLKLLPAGYNYCEIKCRRPKYAVNDSFSANFQFVVCSVDDGKKWLKKLEEMHTLILRKSKVRSSVKSWVLFKEKYRCGHFIPRRSELVRKSQTKNRNTNCPWSLFVIIYRDETQHLIMKVQLYEAHNHPLTESAKFRDVSLEVKYKFFTLFERGFSALEAFEEHRNDLRNEYYTDYKSVSCDRAICPPMPWVYSFYYKRFKSQSAGSYKTYLLNALNDKSNIHNNGECDKKIDKQTDNRDKETDKQADDCDKEKREQMEKYDVNGADSTSTYEDENTTTCEMSEINGNDSTSEDDGNMSEDELSDIGNINIPDTSDDDCESDYVGFYGDTDDDRASVDSLCRSDDIEDTGLNDADKLCRIEDVKGSVILDSDKMCRTNDIEVSVTDDEDKLCRIIEIRGCADDVNILKFSSSILNQSEVKVKSLSSDHVIFDRISSSTNKPEIDEELSTSSSDIKLVFDDPETDVESLSQDLKAVFDDILSKSAESNDISNALRQFITSFWNIRSTVEMSSALTNFGKC